MKSRVLSPNWTEQETSILRANYLRIGAKECALLLTGRTAAQCRCRASKVGISSTKPKSARASFELKFTVTPACWPWAKGKDKDGYGRFKWANKEYPASRFAYILYVGPIPDDLQVCHKCDNPSCVNPDHLFLGTNKENATDRDRKGRTARNYGEAQGTCKLTKEQVLRIRASGAKHAEIAAEFGVSPAQISQIKTGNSWAHLPGATPPRSRTFVSMTSKTADLISKWGNP